MAARRCRPAASPTADRPQPARAAWPAGSTKACCCSPWSSSPAGCSARWARCATRMDAPPPAAAGLPVRGVRHLLHLVLGQGPDAGHEDLAHPRGRPARPAAHPGPRPAALRLQLALVPAAAGGRWRRSTSSGAQIAVLVLGWVAVWALLSRFHPQRQFWHDAWPAPGSYLPRR